jgi:magnesium transporter
VVNLEFVKMIVGLDCCYVTHLEDENTAAFVAELQRRLAAAARGLPSTKSTMDLAAAEGAAAVGGAGAPGLDQLPFELRVLECALDVVSGYLERLTSDLEAAAHPALDALTVKVTTGNLERVRRVKNRLVRLTTRVETLREVLEKFLDDDGDMRDMNLAARAAREAADAARAGAAFDAAAGARAGGAKTPGTPRSLALTYDSEEEEREAVDAVEQLLESYFMQMDNAWNKLQTLTEYVDDTEDYVNIELDSHRNKLIQLNLVLTCFSASVGLITAITGLFAMNTQLYPGNVDKAPFSLFLVIALTSSSLALLLFVGVLGYCRWKKII